MILLLLRLFLFIPSHLCVRNVALSPTGTISQSELLKSYNNIDSINAVGSHLRVNEDDLNSSENKNVFDIPDGKIGLYSKSDMRISNYMECHDKQSYRSPLDSKTGCEIYNGDCIEKSLFLTKLQLLVLIWSCPESCKIPCGTLSYSDAVVTLDDSIQKESYSKERLNSELSLRTLMKINRPLPENKTNDFEYFVHEESIKIPFLNDEQKSYISHTKRDDNSNVHHVGRMSHTVVEVETDCNDDIMYRNPLNPSVGCEMYNHIDCMIWLKVLSRKDFFNIFESCPVTCNVGCGLFSIPSSRPPPLFYDSLETKTRGKSSLLQRKPISLRKKYPELLISTNISSHRQDFIPILLSTTLSLAQRNGIEFSNFSASPSTFLTYNNLSIPKKKFSFKSSDILSTLVPSNSLMFLPSHLPTNFISRLSFSQKSALRNSVYPEKVSVESNNILYSLDSDKSSLESHDVLLHHPSHTLSSLLDHSQSALPLMYQNRFRSSSNILSPSIFPHDSSYPSYSSFYTSNLTHDIQSNILSEISFESSNKLGINSSSTLSYSPLSGLLYDQKSLNTTTVLTNSPSYIQKNISSIYPILQQSNFFIKRATSSDILSVEPSSNPSIEPDAILSLQTTTQVPGNKTLSLPIVTPSITPYRLSSNPSLLPIYQLPYLTKNTSSIIPSLKISSYFTKPSLYPNQSFSLKPTIFSPTLEFNLSTQYPSPFLIDIVSSNSKSLCQDNIQYRSPLNKNFGCELYNDHNCLIWKIILSESDFNNMVDNCPETCNIPCGSYTIKEHKGESGKPVNLSSLHPLKIIPSFHIEDVSSNITIISSTETTVVPSGLSLQHLETIDSKDKEKQMSTPSKFDRSSVVESEVIIFSPSFLPSKVPSVPKFSPEFPITFNPNKLTTIPTEFSSHIPSNYFSNLSSEFPTGIKSRRPNTLNANKTRISPSTQPSSIEDHMNETNNDEKSHFTKSSSPTLWQSSQDNDKKSQLQSTIPSILSSQYPSNAQIFIDQSKLLSTSFRTDITLRLSLVSKMDEKTKSIFEKTTHKFLTDTMSRVEGVQIVIKSIQVISQVPKIESGRFMGDHLYRYLFNIGRYSKKNSKLQDNTNFMMIVIQIEGAISPYISPNDFSFSNNVLNGFKTLFNEYTDRLYDTSSLFKSLGYSQDIINMESLTESTLKSINRNSRLKMNALSVSLIISGIIVSVLLSFLYVKYRKKINDTQSFCQTYTSRNRNFTCNSPVISINNSPSIAISSINSWEHVKSWEIINRNGSKEMEFNNSQLLNNGISDLKNDMKKISSKEVIRQRGNESIPFIKSIEKYDFLQYPVYDCIAQPGPLGIIVDTIPEGPIIHSLKPTSQLLGMISPGDLIVGIDDVNTSGMTALALTNLIEKRKNQRERRISLLKMGVFG